VVFVLFHLTLVCVCLFGQGASSIAAQGALALVIWYGGHQVVTGQMSAGLLISFLFYTLQVQTHTQTHTRTLSPCLSFSGVFSVLFLSSIR